jgi:hypothetical protein
MRASGCVFVGRINRVFEKNTNGRGCGEFVNWAISRLETVSGDVPIVLIDGYAWSAFRYSEGDEDGHLEENAPKVYFERIYATTTPEMLNEFAKRVTDSACKLAKKLKFLLMRPISEMGFDIPKTLSRRMALGFVDELSIPMEDYRKRNARIWAAQDSAHAKCAVAILDPLPYLCRNDRCYGSFGGRPIYVDDDHLSEFGNKLLVPMFAEVFQT